MKRTHALAAALFLSASCVSAAGVAGTDVKPFVKCEVQAFAGLAPATVALKSPEAGICSQSGDYVVDNYARLQPNTTVNKLLNWGSGQRVVKYSCPGGRTLYVTSSYGAGHDAVTSVGLDHWLSFEKTYIDCAQR